MPPRTIPATIHGPAAALLEQWYPGLTGEELVAALSAYREQQRSGSHAHTPGQLVKVGDVMARLQVSRATVFNMLANGTLPRIKIGKATRIPEAALVALESEVGMA